MNKINDQSHARRTRRKIYQQVTRASNCVDSLIDRRFVDLVWSSVQNQFDDISDSIARSVRRALQEENIQ